MPLLSRKLNKADRKPTYFIFKMFLFYKCICQVTLLSVNSLSAFKVDSRALSTRLGGLEQKNLNLKSYLPLIIV